MYSEENMVLREDHPLNMHARRLNLPPSRFIGLPNKRYSRFVQIDLILDNIIHLHASLGWCRQQQDLFHEETQRRSNIMYAAAPAPDAAASTLAGAPAPAVAPTPASGTGALSALMALAPDGGKLQSCKSGRCNHCGSFKLSITKDNDALACENCGVVGAQVQIAQHREKACAEEDDKTTHADKPMRVHDRFNHPTQSTIQVRKELDSATRGENISARTRARAGLGYVAERVNREVARAKRIREKMSIAEQTKEIHILQHMDKHFLTIEPLTDALKKHCRVLTWKVWQAAVLHGERCVGKTCHFDIRGRTPNVIAEAILVCALRRLQHGEETVEGVSQSTLLHLNDKLSTRRAAKDSGGSRTVIEQVTQIMASLADAPADELEFVIPTCAECAPWAVAPQFPGSRAALEPSQASDAESSSLASSPCCPCPQIGRSESDLSIGEPHSFLLELRNAINLVFSLLIAPRTSVKKVAIAALNDPKLRNTIQSKTFETVNVKALALVMLQAAALELEARRGKSGDAGTPPAGASAQASAPLPASKTRLVASLGVSLSEVDTYAACVRSALSASLFDDASENDDLL
jgi:hypothetical protein